MYSQREASEAEQYELLTLALRECVEAGVSDANLLYLCWATGYNVNHLDQIKKEVDEEAEDFFKNLVFMSEGRN